MWAPCQIFFALPSDRGVSAERLVVPVWMFWYEGQAEKVADVYRFSADALRK